MDFFKIIYPKMREAIRNTLEAFWIRLQNSSSSNVGMASYPSIDTNKPILKEKISNQFELFGYDFMIDDDMNVYLIEVNTNPCLDTSPCPLL